jgi:hypothetical protein
VGDNRINFMFPWKLYFCLLQVLFIWCCIRNQQKFALRICLAGVGLIIWPFLGSLLYKYLTYETILNSNYFPLIVISEILGPLMAFAGFIGLMVKKKFYRCLAGLSAVLLVTFLSFWVYISSQVAHLSLSKDRYCKMQFHQWYTGRCVLSYFDNGICLGTVILDNGFLTDPWAIFPGPDGKSVVCLSELDLTDAAFTVNFTKCSNQGVTIPMGLQDAVDRSDFEVRACTRKEVNFVENFIKTADSSVVAGCLRGGLTPSYTREDWVNYFRCATSPNDWRDPVLKDAKPQILPEN